MIVRSGKRALEDVQRFTAMFPGLVAVLTDMAEVESIEKLADAAEQRLQAANDGIAGKQQELEALSASHEQAKAKADAAIAEKLASADALAQTRQVEADALVAKARSAASVLVTTAQKTADDLKAAEQEKIDALVAQTGQHEDNLKFAAARLDAMNKRIADTQVQLTEVEQHKAALLAKLG